MKAKQLNNVRIDFANTVNLNEIAIIKLYYGGTERPNAGADRFAPVDYISSFVQAGRLAQIFLIR